MNTCIYKKFGFQNNTTKINKFFNSPFSKYNGNSVN